MFKKLRTAIFGPKVYRMKAETGHFEAEQQALARRPVTRPIHDEETRRRQEEDAGLSILNAAVVMDVFSHSSDPGPAVDSAPPAFDGGGGDHGGGGASGGWDSGSDSSASDSGGSSD